MGGGKEGRKVAALRIYMYVSDSTEAALVLLYERKSICMIHARESVPERGLVKRGEAAWRSRARGAEE